MLLLIYPPYDPIFYFFFISLLDVARACNEFVENLNLDAFHSLLVFLYCSAGLVGSVKVIFLCVYFSVSCDRKIINDWVI